MARTIGLFSMVLYLCVLITNTSNAMKKEIWNPVKDFEGLYEVSNLGNIKSLINRDGNGDKVLKSIPQKTGYVIVTLCKDKVQTVLLIHRIVGLSLIPNPENKPCINHIDGIKTNNEVENLEWVTYSENARHAIDNGLWTIRRGKDHHCYGKTTSNKQKKVVSELFKGNEYQAKEYKILSTEGKILTIFNMHKFCRNYKKDKLHPSGMIRAALGERKSHKGFKTLLIS